MRSVVAALKRAVEGRTPAEIARLVVKNISYATYRLTPAARRARERASRAGSS